MFSFITKSFKNVKIDKSKSKSKIKSLIIDLTSTSVYVEGGEYYQYKRLSAILASSLLLSGGLIVLLILALVSLFPLKTTEFKFVQFFPKEEQVVSIENFRANKSRLRAIKEYLARDYIIKRETVDLATEEDRYSEVLFVSSNDMKQEFLRLYKQDNPASPYANSFKNKTLLKVYIHSSNPLNDNQVQVQYAISKVDKISGNQISYTKYISIVSFVEDSNKEYTNDNYLNNVFGFLVSDYSKSIDLSDNRDNSISNSKGLNNTNNSNLIPNSQNNSYSLANHKDLEGSEIKNNKFVNDNKVNSSFDNSDNKRLSNDLVLNKNKELSNVKELTHKQTIVDKKRIKKERLDDKKSSITIPKYRDYQPSK